MLIEVESNRIQAQCFDRPLKLKVHRHVEFIKKQDRIGIYILMRKIQKDLNFLRIIQYLTCTKLLYKIIVQGSCRH